MTSCVQCIYRQDGGECKTKDELSTMQYREAGKDVGFQPLLSVLHNIQRRSRGSTPGQGNDRAGQACHYRAGCARSL